ncbi:YybH family protein [Pseudocolwellia agarivorans]|uniref:YybH family protein n=1 Tax=Pseudocolwellia agarivorans TaxID=1911682 RepID=UPI003F882496
MKKAVLLSLLFVTTMSVSGFSSAFGLAEALKQPTFKNKKDADKANEVTEVKKSSEVKALEAAITDWTNAFNNKDVAAMMSIYDKDSVYASPNLEIIKGVESIQAWYEAYFSEMDGTLTYEQESITEKGGVGTVILKFYITPNNSDTAVKVFKGRAMLVFKKKFLGDWLLLSHMAHTTH